MMPRLVSQTIALLFLLAVAPGCPRADAALVIVVASDLTPYEEVDRIETELVGVGLVTITNVDRRDALDAGIEVFDRRLAPLAGRRVRITALRAGVVVVTRDLTLDHLADRTVRVILPRACEHADCAADETCIRGSCAGTACVEGGELGCPPPDCTSDDDCTASVACAAAACREGTCVVFGSDDACASTEWCDPDEGCALRRATRDAGVGDGDGGASDGAIQDAGAEDATVEDATVEDATVEDATVEDATVEDAAADASIDDAGSEDAARADAGAASAP